MKRVPRILESGVYLKMNDENFTPSVGELSQDQWWLLLWSLITDIPEKEWKEFTHDLIYKDRFSSSHKVVDVIKGFSGKCTATIKEGQVLYRARVYHQDPLREFLSDVFKNPNTKKPIDRNDNINEYYNMQLATVIMAVKKGSPRAKEIIASYDKWQRKRFKGYKASDSGAPPADIGSAGRINPERIQYLYLAEDPETAIYEVRPTIGQHVSVAYFKIMEELKIYDLAREIKSQEGEAPGNDYTLFNVIQQRFSEPNIGDTFRYLPTQYLGERIKHMGFDGLRFKSSLKNGGINVVLFDDKKCKAFRSDMIKVGNIELKFENPEIYQLEELMKNDEGVNQ